MEVVRNAHKALDGKPHQETVEDVAIDGRTLNCILNKQGMQVWTELIWFRI
jgi:hypothetical protein